MSAHISMHKLAHKLPQHISWAGLSQCGQDVSLPGQDISLPGQDMGGTQRRAALFLEASN